MSEQAKKTVIGSVVFVDIVEYSQKTVAKQLALKGWFNDITSQALKNIPVTERIVLDTGDGAALCFLGDPEEALFAANSLRVALIESDYPELTLRMGINLGPLKIVKDINGQPNVIGDAINVAQRVMSFSQPNQILVSRSYYEVVARLSDEYLKLFHYLGIHKDKHIREHEVYEVCVTSTAGGAAPAVKEQVAVQVEVEKAVRIPEAEQAPVTSLDPQTLARLEASLAQHIGPLAKLIAKQAAQKTTSFQELCQMLAESVPAGEHRTAFLRDVEKFSSIPSSAHKGASVAAPSESVAARGGSEARKTKEWNPATLTLVEQHLARCIGPLARILVKKTAGNAVSVDELLRVLAKNIESEEERKAFLKLADKIH